MEVNWTPISRTLYAAIYAELQEQLTVFGTCSAPQGDEIHYNPYMYTEWGFKDSDAPLIRSIGNKEDHEEDTKWEWEYWIAKVKDTEV